MRGCWPGPYATFLSSCITSRCGVGAVGARPSSKAAGRDAIDAASRRVLESPPESMAKRSDPTDDWNPYAPPSVTAEIGPTTDDDEPELVLAERGTRWVARFVDNILLGLASLPAFVLGDWKHLGDPLGWLLLIFIPGALVAYQWYLVATSGQSLAKRWMKIKIVRLDGGPVGFTQGVVLRGWAMFLLEMIPYLGTVAGLVDVLLIFNADRRCLHDRLAGTKVVLAPLGY